MNCLCRLRDFLTQKPEETFMTVQIKDKQIEVTSDTLKSYSKALHSRVKHFKDKNTGVYNLTRWLQSSANEEDEKAFLSFLDFLKDGKVQVTPQNKLLLLHIADEFHIEILRDQCNSVY